MPTPSHERAPRRDAVRNRARLVDAAAAAFRDHGLDASVNAIAAAAGVNVATLYRHFPTKDALLDAVLDVLVEPLAGACDEALATAGPVLPVFLRAAARAQVKSQGLGDWMMRQPEHSPLRQRVREPALALVEPVVQRARAQGEVPVDMSAVDLLVVLRMASVAATAPTLSGAQREWHLEVLARGLRPG